MADSRNGLDTVLVLPLPIMSREADPSIQIKLLKSASFWLFPLSENNQLTPSFSSLGDKVIGYLGKYSGREEDEYLPIKAGNGIFYFFVQSAFEVQNRLLEKGDT